MEQTELKELGLFTDLRFN